MKKYFTEVKNVAYIIFTVLNYCFRSYVDFWGFFTKGTKWKKNLKIALPCTSVMGHIITAHLNLFQSRKNTLIKMHKIWIFLLVKARIHFLVILLVDFNKLHTFIWQSESVLIAGITASSTHIIGTRIRGSKKKEKLKWYIYIYINYIHMLFIFRKSRI